MSARLTTLWVLLVSGTTRTVQSLSYDSLRIRLPRKTPMPPPIRSNVPETWAYDTMSRRVREEILDKVVYGDNEPALDGEVGP